MRGPKEKKERALGEKLFLKAERCNSPKCAMVKRPYRPGVHTRPKRGFSEYGLQLKEKQKFRITYGLNEAQMRRIFKEALSKEGVTGEEMIELMERRLDNVVFRLGLAASRIIARQLIVHGHILINGRVVTSPSRKIKKGDVIKIKESSKNKGQFKNLETNLKRYNPPSWLSLDKEKLEGKVVSKPEDVDLPFNINLVVEYYSK